MTLDLNLILGASSLAALTLAAYLDWQLHRTRVELSTERAEALEWRRLASVWIVRGAHEVIAEGRAALAEVERGAGA